MVAELARFAAGWPLILSLALVVSGRAVLAGRRRMALNEALHELRRPLQALALVVPASLPAGEELTRQAAAALVRLEREVNGETEAAVVEPLPVAPLLAAAVARWADLARRAGTALTLAADGAPAVVRGDRDGLERALDNLIVNAVEHGGPRVSVVAETAGGLVRIVVRDTGVAGGGAAGAGRADAGRRRLGTFARLSGRRRRGHGLRVVRRVAAAHGGELRLRRRRGGTEAVLELPLAAAAGGAERA